MTCGDIVAVKGYLETHLCLTESEQLQYLGWGEFPRREEQTERATSHVSLEAERAAVGKSTSRYPLQTLTFTVAV